jgi:phosphatidylglycerol---prolipoprotein diacylglyceryl transferase
MLTYPSINPVALKIGPIKFYWYGIMYLIGFAGGWLLARSRAKKPNSGWTDVMVNDLVFYVALGVILGGRLGYMLFYATTQIVNDPLSLLKIWEGGMSFHGGLIGVLIAVWLFGRKFNKHWADITDFIAPLIPIGLATGRIGNFINGELWGRVTDMPWGMVFPHVDSLPRHPSQLYEFFLEGVVLFTILWIYSAKPRPRYAVSGLFALLYGLIRFNVEFFRQPDVQLGFVAFDWLTMGQILSLPLVLIGLFLLYLSHRQKVA